MTRPFVVAQLSDPHLGAAWAGHDPAARLEAAVGAIRSLPQRPDAVLVTGDLTEHAGDAEYEQARELLEPLAPYVLPGNHDAREPLRRHFDLPGAGAEPVRYTVDFGPLRLVVLDSTRPGADDGSLDGGRLEWLDAELAAVPDLPTVIAMHHPPLVTGVGAWDDFALAADDRRALAAIVARHRHVGRIVAGHVHRAMTAELAGRPVVVAPSTYVQLRLDFGAQEIALSDEPGGFALHTLLDGEIVSHTQHVN